MIDLKIKRLHPGAIIPQYQTEGAACFDLHAVGLPADGSSVDNYIHGPLEVRTGLAFEIPQGHVMLIYSRSGMGFNLDIRLANCVGVIDADYVGEVMVKLTSDTDSVHGVFNGDRIAQAMIMPIPRVSLIEVEELSKTERGAGGMGSTGK